MTTTAPAELTGLITQVLHADPSLVTRETCLADLGLNSVAELELIVLIEDHYRVTVDFSTFATLNTVGKLSDAIISATQNPARRLIGTVDAPR
jgi:acyl carrier protein